jgi:hypothetical protein
VVSKATGLGGEFGDEGSMKGLTSSVDSSIDGPMADGLTH